MKTSKAVSRRKGVCEENFTDPHAGKKFPEAFSCPKGEKVDPDRIPIEAWLPTSRKEMEKRGWEQADIILLSGDAYVDHPSFGIAVIGRVLEAAGYKVAILPQPNWKDDGRDFKKLGKPRLFFGVSAGSMDSMVNHYTARKRLRSDDAYTPGGQAGFRPDYPTIVYTKLLKGFFPDTPVVIGGIEASMRRITHYDYWQDRLRPSFLVESGADLLVYGMGEKPVVRIAEELEKGNGAISCRKIPQVSYLCEEVPEADEALWQEIGQGNVAGRIRRKENDRAGNEPSPIEKKTDTDTRIEMADGLTESPGENKQGKAERPQKADRSNSIADLFLHPHKDCLQSKRAQAENFAQLETASNRIFCGRIIQETEKGFVVINPPFVYDPEKHEIDASFDLPYTRLPHPRYKSRGDIPAFVMIRNSVNLHRGCFGGCSFCTISAHQGKQVQSRSEQSILNEIEKITRMPYFRGTLSDLGGPSANMYGMGGKDRSKCLKCQKPSCLFPAICPNLNHDHGPLLDLYRKVDRIAEVRHAYIGSGIRYDMIVPYLKEGSKNHAREYIRWVIVKGVSGRLKVAPEHTENAVLEKMRKMPFWQFETFKRFFDACCREEGLNQQLIPYFISAHPGCTLRDMKELETKTRQLGYHLEQVQLFTPTPLTLSTEMYYTGLDPYTLEPVFVEKDMGARDRQTECFFWYKGAERRRTDRRNADRHTPRNAEDSGRQRKWRENRMAGKTSGAGPKR